MPARPAFLLAAVLAIAALALACDGSGPSDTPTPGATATATAEPTATAATPTPSATAGPQVDCSPNPARELGDLTWEDILPAAIPAPSGWRIEEDAGSGPFLAVFDGEERVGSVELLQFAHEAVFDPEQGIDALLDWAARYYESIREDRLAGYGPGYEFEPADPQAAPFGDRCGIAYGFTATDESGKTAERFDGYAPFDRSNLYLVTAFYDAATAAEGIGFIDQSSLLDYEAAFGELVSRLRLP